MRAHKLNFIFIRKEKCDWNLDESVDHGHFCNCDVNRATQCILGGCVGGFSKETTVATVEEG